MGSASSPPICSSEKAVRPLTAVVVSCPAVGEHPDLGRRSEGAPTWHHGADGVAAQLDVATEYQAVVPRASRFSEMVQVKWATSSSTANENHTGSSDVSFGQEAKTSVRLGNTR
jgi:hypothetical protein